MIQCGWKMCRQVLSLLKNSLSLNLSRHITHSLIPNSSTTLSPFLNLTRGICFSYSRMRFWCTACASCWGITWPSLTLITPTKSIRLCNCLSGTILNSGSCPWCLLRQHRQQRLRKLDWQRKQMAKDENKRHRNTMMTSAIAIFPKWTLFGLVWTWLSLRVKVELKTFVVWRAWITKPTDSRIKA